MAKKKTRKTRRPARKPRMRAGHRFGVLDVRGVRLRGNLQPTVSEREER